ncbi:MAG: HD domain-containing protein [Candidatus Eremiobacteraeota bacterium]|nr:HD domain-containing protein [Candidatus Eremiobacteraeota bacterium]MBV8222264.1 HD domain-containing protein [Candidatus Eremiobacteraeota bacterium]
MSFWSLELPPEAGARAVAALAVTGLVWAVLAAWHAPVALAALVACAVVLELFAGDILRAGGRVISPSLTIVVAAFALYGTPAAVLVGFARGGARLLSSRALSSADGAFILAGSVFGPMLGGVVATLASAFGVATPLAAAFYAVTAFGAEVLAPAACMRSIGPPSLALAGDGIAGWALAAFGALTALGYLLARDITVGDWRALGYFVVPLIVVRISYSALRARSERYLTALERENVDFFDKIGKLDRINGDLIEALAFAVDYRDGIDSGRSRRTAQVATSMGQTLGYASTELETLRRGALLHDVGMLAMPGQRTPRHVEVGTRLVARWRDYAQVAEIVEQHCELLDGSGYPHGLRADAIGMPARIVGLATKYVDLTTPRPLGAGMSHDEALDEIRTMTPDKYDPMVVQALEAVSTPASADVLPLIRREKRAR